MTEKPILFSTEMVRAILDGRKTQTRRVIKPQPPEYTAPICGPEEYEPVVIDRYGDKQEGKPIYGIYDDDGEWGVKCPYAPGDILWVRETWAINDSHPDYTQQITVYRASVDDVDEYLYTWRPSIHMPRKASRLSLRVEAVRAERLQDISEADAKAEGLRVMQRPESFGGGVRYLAPECGDRPPYWERDPRDAFMWLWDSLNAAPKPVYKGGEIISYVSYPWDDVRETRTHRGKPWVVIGNPWIFAYTFEVIDNASR